jgi:hypothetical protein
MQLAQQQLVLAGPFGQDFQTHPIQDGAGRGRSAYRGGGQVGRGGHQMQHVNSEEKKGHSGNDVMNVVSNWSEDFYEQ